MADIEIPDPDEVAEKAENPFTKLIALCVTVYAVGMAFGSFGGNNNTEDMLLSKSEEARAENLARQEEFNTWSQYQAKSIREALYRNEKDKLQAEKDDNPSAFPAYKQKLLASYADQEARMKKDKDELSDKAKKAKADGDARVQVANAELARFLRKDPYFDLAEVAFNLAIVMASVSMLSGKRWAFYASAGLAVIGAVMTVNGFFLLCAIPGVDTGTG